MFTKEGTMEKKITTKASTDLLDKDWRSVYLANLRGESDEAQQLEPFIKQNYKGNAYLPWAVMEKFMYLQDPTAFLEPIVREENGCLSVVHTSATQIDTDTGTLKTSATCFAHFVVVKLVFLGKTFLEYYPIQDNEYKPPKVYDQNIVNRAIQRAKAKIIARGTGLGLSLYESGDLQFEEGVEAKAQRNKATVVERTKEALKTMDKATVGEITNVVGDEGFDEATVTVDDSTLTEIYSLFDSNREDVKVEKLLRSYNTAFIKNHQFSLSFADPKDVWIANLQKLPDPAKFLRSVQEVLNR